MPKKHNSKGDTETHQKTEIMLEDSVHGTMCSIHQRVNSTDHFPCSDHQVIHLCSNPNSPSGTFSHVPLKFAKKEREGNPKPRSSSSPGKRRKAYTTVIPRGHATTCNPKICATMLFSASPSSVSVKSKSCICLDHLVKGPNGSPHTNEMVNDLRNEIRKVKRQLRNFSDCSSKPKLAITASSRDQCEYENTKCVSKLKTENKKLKRDLDVKKRLLESFKTSIEKAKEILNDYERKVCLLHDQAVKSSNLMRLSKDKFCKCLKDKDDKIKSLTLNNHSLAKAVEEKTKESKDFTQKYQLLESLLQESNQKCTALCDKNENFCQMVEDLKSQLNASTEVSEKYKENIKALEEKVSHLNCSCKKLAQKNKKHKESYEEKLKEFENREEELKEQNLQLSEELEEFKKTKDELQDLLVKYNQIKEQMKEYEQYASKCQRLEAKCQKQFDTMLKNEKMYHLEQEEMRKLVEELTMVVKQNKITLLQMSEINKHQDSVIKSQSEELMSKEEKMRLVEKESENYKQKTVVLEKEMEELRQCLSQPCSNEDCINRTKELEEVRNALNVEKDCHFVKQQIIQDQSATIIHLQCQIQDKIKELGKAQNDTAKLENDINKINSELMRKHHELNKELNEKENLIDKLQVLENQRVQLSDEMCDLEFTLNNYISNTVGQNQLEKEKLTELKDQIETQKREWDAQKDILAREKALAVKAANFATQKLVETVADFQKQVDAQRKVQLLLTKMLHAKDEELKRVTSKMSFISHLTKQIDHPTKELYRNQQPGCCASNPTTTNSFYSLKSKSSSKKVLNGKCNSKCPPYVEIQEVLDLLNTCVAEENQMGDVKDL